MPTQGIGTRQVRRMFEVDFLPVENELENGTKSGDAITVRFTEALTNASRIVVIDGGFKAIGEKVVEHVKNYYGTTTVDLVISTHPDADHLNGLAAVLESLTVGEILIHLPREHGRDVQDFSNIESIDNIVGIAQTQRVKVTEPFTGLSRFNGAVTILGPTESYYEELVDQHLEEVRGKYGVLQATKAAIREVRDSILDKAAAYLPIETLRDDGLTGPRNNCSVVTLIQAGGERLMFTGDAGISALERAADAYEMQVGPFNSWPLNFFQAPHHGSRRNLGPSILDRILGTTGEPFGTACSFISSAKAAPKHPSPRVTNALKRRGCSVHPTEGRSILHHLGAPQRPGWSPITPLPYVHEDSDE